MSNCDHLFAEKNIFEKAVFVKGLCPVAATEDTVLVKSGASDGDGSFVLPIKGRRSVFVIRFDQKPRALRAALCDTDPRTLGAGESICTARSGHLPYFEAEPAGENADFL